MVFRGSGSTSCREIGWPGLVTTTGWAGRSGALCISSMNDQEIEVNQGFILRYSAVCVNRRWEGNGVLSRRVPVRPRPRPAHPPRLAPGGRGLAPCHPIPFFYKIIEREAVVYSPFGLIFPRRC